MTTETIDLFPIPLVRLNVGEQFAKEFALLRNERSTKHNVKSHHFSVDRYILNKECYKNLKDFISEETTRFMVSKMNIDGESEMTLSWVNWNLPKEFTHTHIHPNSIASGILYLETTDSNNLINFHRLHAHSNRNILEPKTFDRPHPEAEMKYVSNISTVKVKNGDFLIFPSYLPHSVPTNNSEMTRISLAYNAVTKHKIGSYEKSNELDFKILSENT